MDPPFWFNVIKLIITPMIKEVKQKSGTQQMNQTGRTF